MELAPSDYFIFRELNRSFTSMGIWSGGMVTITGKGTPEQGRGILMTVGGLQKLRITPMLGRAVSAQDAAPRRRPTVMLTHGYWQRKFSGNSSVVGDRILVDGQSKEVIGIMPAYFRFLDEKPDLLMPHRFNRAKSNLGNYSYRGVARLKPGVSLTRA